MNIIKSILLVVFVIIAILLVLLVLVQNDEGNGMGSAFGGQSAAFGAHSASVLSKTTAVFVTLFFVVVFTLAFLNKSPSDDTDLMQQAAEQVNEGSTETTTDFGWDPLAEEVQETVEETPSIVNAEQPEVLDVPPAE
ncbi:MAG: preprotein translocase subunit SecG [Treponema sp.]|nr:preprotein translocase subunit SecG [Treponema sp.]